MTRSVCILSAMLVLSILQVGARGQAATVEIVRDPQATRIERLAAQEVRRYIYARTGSLLTIRTTLGDADLGECDRDR